MKKKPASPNTAAPLLSRQWRSQSTRAADTNRAADNSPSISGSPGETPKLYIYRGGVDVSGQTTSALVGETVGLTAVIKPSRFAGSNWRWTVPDLTIKEFRVEIMNGAAISGTTIDYDALDFEQFAVSIHWIDGGVKAIGLTATVDGKELSASTAINVIRPTVVLTATLQGPIIQPDGSIPNVWGAFAKTYFLATGLSHPGELQWVQVGVFKQKVIDLQGVVIDNRNLFGLDYCKYPQATGLVAGDQPSIPFVSSIDRTVIRTLELMMYLMYKPAGGIFVPLRSKAWLYNGTLESTGTTSAPIWKAVSSPLINPMYQDQPTVDEMTYPEWGACFVA